MSWYASKEMRPICQSAQTHMRIWLQKTEPEREGIDMPYYVPFIPFTQKELCDIQMSVTFAFPRDNTWLGVYSWIMNLSFLPSLLCSACIVLFLISQIALSFWLVYNPQFVYFTICVVADKSALSPNMYSTSHWVQSSRCFIRSSTHINAMSTPNVRKYWDNVLF